MKKMFAAALAGLLIAGTAFCEKLDVPLDEYDDGTAAAQEQKNDLEARRAKKEQKAKKETKIKWNTKANKLAGMQGDPYNQKKMIGKRGFTDRLLNINKFTKVEPFSAYLKPTVGNMFVRKGHLIYREGTDVGGYMMYYDDMAFAIQFAQADRAIAVDAINRYFDDFDQKRLNRSAKRKNTREIYGFCNAYEDYGVVSGMMTYYARPKVFFGYVFVKNSPYFTINVRQAKNLAVNEKTEEGSLKATAIEQTYYLTKAQAQKLAAFLGDQNIDSLYAQSSDDFDSNPAAADDYNDAAGQAAQQSQPAEPAPAQSVQLAQPEEQAQPQEPAQTQPLPVEQAQ